MAGANKLLLPFPKDSVVRCAVRGALASGVGAVGVVVDSDEGPIVDALEGLSVQLIVNREAHKGAATSVLAAAEWALGQNSALMLTLADEPTVDPAILRRAADHWFACVFPTLRIRYRDRPGHPVLLSRAVLGSATSLEGDAGFRQRLRAEGAPELAVSDPAPIDIDTESDYRAALARLTH